MNKEERRDKYLLEHPEAAKRYRFEAAERKRKAMRSQLMRSRDKMIIDLRFKQHWRLKRISVRYELSIPHVSDIINRRYL